jgi:hypothetical protein
MTIWTQRCRACAKGSELGDLLSRVRDVRPHKDLIGDATSHLILFSNQVACRVI